MNIWQRFWRWLLSLFWRRDLRVAIIGFSKAGKTTLVRALAREDTTVETTPTFGRQVSNVRIGRVNFSIVDIGGNDVDMSQHWRAESALANVIVYVIDAADQEKFNSVEQHLQEFLQHQDIQNKPIVFVANKQDLPEAFDRDRLKSRINLHEIEGRKVAIFDTSALRKEGVDEIPKWIMYNV